MASFIHDLRAAGRALGKNPGFAVVAVLTLAIGIGASSAVLNLIQGVLLTPPPYPNPEQIVLIKSAKTDGQPYAYGASPQQWTEWRREAKSFTSLSGYVWTFDYLTQSTGSEFFQGIEVTPDYFKVIGTQPLLGRTFVESDATAKGDTVIVLGYDFWQRHFNGDPNVLGQTIRITRAQPPLAIVGVMPPGVRFLPAFSNADFPNYDINARVDYWVPITSERYDSPEWNVAARLRAGVTLTQANAELASLAARQAATKGQFDGLTARAELLESELNRDGQKLLLPLLGAVLLVFLIACGNVAGLLLARGLQRQSEYAMRTALGAPRIRLFRQALIESFLLAFAGGVVGVGLATGIIIVLRGIGGEAIPRLDAVTISWPVLLFGLGSALAAAVLAGFIPALRATRADAAAVLKGAGPNASASRVQRRLFASVAVAQTALTLALLVGSGLLIRTVSNLTQLRPGFGTDNILTMSVALPNWNGKEWYSFHVRALEKISVLSGVQHAAFGWGLPLTGDKWLGPIHLSNEPGKLVDSVTAAKRAVTPDFFAALGMRIVDGRPFRASDNLENWKSWPDFVPGETPFVCILNEVLAKRLFPNGNAVRQTVWVGPWTKRPSQVVGIVANARMESLTQSLEPEVYTPFLQSPVFSKHLIVRSATNPALLIDALRRELRAIAPTVSIENIRTLEQVRTQSISAQLFAMRLLLGFSMVGCALSLVGIYSVLSLSVRSRRREIAVRMAIGAQRWNILQLVVQDGMRLLIGGLLLGMGAALILARLFRALLFEVTAIDPMLWVGVGGLFVVVAVAACWFPARQAMQVPPAEALR